MGVMDFVKDAGASIGIGSSKKDEMVKKAAEAKRAAELKKAQDARIAAAKKAAAAAKERAAAAAKAKALADKAKADKAAEAEREKAKGIQLTQHLSSLGLKGRQIGVRYDDGVAYLSGSVADRATKEKMILALGNVSGVRQVRDTIKVLPAPASAAPNSAASKAKRQEAAAAAQMYTVKSGDTLSKIAKDLLGDANRYPEIFKANQPMLTDPNMIMVGQVLRIPKK